MLSLRRRFVAALVIATALAATLVPAAGAETDGSFAWPTSGRISQPYGCTGFWAEPRRGSCAHFHGGIDIANRRGTPIRAAADGVVSHVGWDPWMPRRIASWMVIINHGGGLQTMYAHMRAKAVDGISRGARVTKGQLIGLMDSTGMSTGPHLHLSFIKNGSWVNPRDYIDGQPERRNSRRRSAPAKPACAVFGAGMGAWLGGATALVLEFDTPSACAG